MLHITHRRTLYESGVGNLSSLFFLNLKSRTHRHTYGWDSVCIKPAHVAVLGKALIRVGHVSIDAVTQITRAGVDPATPV
jgi:hypothetical protein